MQVKTQEEFVTVGEAARMLRFSRGTIYRAIESGSLKAIRLSPSGPLRIPIKEIRERAEAAGEGPAA